MFRPGGKIGEVRQNRRSRVTKERVVGPGREVKDAFICDSCGRESGTRSAVEAFRRKKALT